MARIRKTPSKRLPFTGLKKVWKERVDCRPIFKGRSFFVDSSIHDLDRRAYLSYNLIVHGGTVSWKLDGADILLVDEQKLPSRSIPHLQIAYAHSPDPSLQNLIVLDEQTIWRHVQREIILQPNEPTTKVPMGGSKTGFYRTPFSQADKNNLAFYLSRKIPDKAAGGRYGNKVYEELSENPHKEMQWARRHTWQSWRQHYVKNDTDIDSRISEFVISHPPLNATKYNSDRRVTRRMTRRTSTEKMLKGRD
ncbi:hypothetical protein PC9H_008843 [Pleurotus ostreatus]|nr:uncharacterized protein PC9H_008843 [Pleurotus ostreatus]KAF7426474.1 hypothetical protein PC9H_008843 [Pleurotus ostreatus]KAJ8694024.1 hypothetical protein PTI98_008957 [Pleurotus ostreatus]KDQ32197.1 hypothetical protein PLEOSDRAFT_1100702 [Pleurotus ostreatus PC15]